MDTYYVYTNTKINMVSHEFNSYQLIVIINKYKNGIKDIETILYNTKTV